MKALVKKVSSAYMRRKSEEYDRMRDYQQERGIHRPRPPQVLTQPGSGNNTNPETLMRVRVKTEEGLYERVAQHYFNAVLSNHVMEQCGIDEVVDPDLAARELHDVRDLVKSKKFEDFLVTNNEWNPSLPEVPSQLMDKVKRQVVALKSVSPRAASSLEYGFLQPRSAHAPVHAEISGNSFKLTQAGKKQIEVVSRSVDKWWYKDTQA